jgi:hypothetical protein
MRSRGRCQKQVIRRIRQDRRRLGRFVIFAEMLADLRPLSLLDQAAPASKAGSGRGLARTRGRVSHDRRFRLPGAEPRKTSQRNKRNVGSA